MSEKKTTEDFLQHGYQPNGEKEHITGGYQPKGVPEANVTAKNQAPITPPKGGTAQQDK